jgi:hypothetical protein
VPRPSRPQIAVVVLTLMTHPGLWRLVKEKGPIHAWQKNTRRGMNWIEQFSGQDRLWDRCRRKIGTGLTSCASRQHGSRRHIFPS